MSKKRKETGFGKRRLAWYLAAQDRLIIPESTIGKILKKKGLTRKKKRVRREYHRIKYNWASLKPFEVLEIDTKEIADQKTLPKEVYLHAKENDFIPKWQWTVIEPKTRIRFMAWSYQNNWFCGQIFCKMVVFWLRYFGFRNRITLWSDGGVEFSPSSLSAFEKAAKNFWQPLGIERKIIRKDHPEDNPFVERSLQTDDYEFYIPYLMKVKSEQDFIRISAWWLKIYNLVRPHQQLKNLTPYQKIRSLNFDLPKAFCLFPSLILDHCFTLSEVFPLSKSVQKHLDYDLKTKG